MSQPELMSRFQSCLAYESAQPWQKPLRNPRRFLVNQLRCRGLLRQEPGALRQVAAFHLPDFTVVTGDAVSEQIASYGIYEKTLTEAFLRLVSPGQTVVDIGMHVGYYTSLFALMVGESGQVHSFEPTPSTREIALRNIGRFPQVTVHPQAVWSSVQTMTFKDYGLRWMAFNSFTDARLENEQLNPKPFQVETTTLDNFREHLGRPIHLLKIDAESAERDIILGAEKLLQSDHPILSLEVGDFEQNPSASRDLIELLNERGYAAWEFESGKFQRHTPKKTYSYDNLLFVERTQDLSSR